MTDAGTTPSSVQASTVQALTVQASTVQTTTGQTSPGQTPSSPDTATADERSLFEQMGGHEAFVQLVEVFYQGIAQDEVLRPMYPDEDLGEAQRRLLMFLTQYWGGPHTYSDERGHPRLRARHAPFRVNAEARDRWLLHMRHAVDSLSLNPMLQSQLWDYLERAAWQMVNTLDA